MKPGEVYQGHIKKFVLRFAQSIDENTLSQSVAMYNEREPMEYDGEYNAEDNTYTITPKTVLESGSVYTIEAARTEESQNMLPFARAAFYVRESPKWEACFFDSQGKNIKTLSEVQAGEEVNIRISMNRANTTTEKEKVFVYAALKDGNKLINLGILQSDSSELLAAPKRLNIKIPENIKDLSGHRIIVYCLLGSLAPVNQWWELNYSP